MPFVDVLREEIFLRFLWNWFRFGSASNFKKQNGKFQGAVLQILTRMYCLALACFA
jgi:hypothetical protein